MKVSGMLLFMFLFSVVMAQQESGLTIRQKNISVNIGHCQFKEENLHPKVFSGMQAGASFTHTKMKTNISEYTAGINLSLLNTGFETFPTSISALIQADYTYLFPALSHEKWTYFIGPVADLQYGTNAYFNWDESHLYFANYLSGGIANRLFYKMGRHDLVFNLDLPLISFISRPSPNRQYKIDDFTFTGVIKNLAGNPEIALPDKNFYLNAGAELLFQNKKNKTRSLGYNFRYHFMQANQGEPYRFVAQSIQYKFYF